MPNVEIHRDHRSTHGCTPMLHHLDRLDTASESSGQCGCALVAEQSHKVKVLASTARCQTGMPIAPVSRAICTNLAPCANTRQHPSHCVPLRSSPCLHLWKSHRCAMCLELPPRMVGHQLIHVWCACLAASDRSCRPSPYPSKIQSTTGCCMMPPLHDDYIVLKGVGSR